MLAAGPEIRAAKVPTKKLQYTSRSPVKIRVRIAKKKERVSLRGFDMSIYEYRPGNSSSDFSKAKLSKKNLQLIMAPHEHSQWLFRCDGSKVLAIPKGKGSVIELKAPVLLKTGAGYVTYDGKPYREELRIYPNGKQCDVVNALDIERYLDGIVNMEFSSKWNSESVKAQVIAARTYAVYKIRQSRKGKVTRYFDVESTIRDQAYGGPLKEDMQASRSVEQTRGLVLTYKTKDGTPYPIKAFYHSTCGGKTELPQNVWGSRHSYFKKNVPCKFCRSSPRYSWTLELDEQELKRRIFKGALRAKSHKGWPKDWKPVMERGRLVDLELGKLNKSGRIKTVRTKWKYKKKSLVISFKANAFRNWIGTQQLRSTSFVRNWQKDLVGKTRRIVFRGKGNGHGVGMCQYGAKGMGEKGFSMASILKHYYPRADLTKIW